MRIVELLFGSAFAIMALWGLLSGDIYVLGGKANAGSGGWASFGDSPTIFLLALSLYLLCGITLIRGGLKADE